MKHLNLLWDDQKIVITDQQTTKEIPNGSQSPCLDVVKQITDCLPQFQDYEGIVVNNLNQPVFEEEGKTYDVAQLLSESSHQVCVLAGENDDAEALLKSAREDFVWKMKYVGYHPGKDEYSVESLLTVGNGYFGLRGTLPEMKISDGHYPATYFAGLYNQAKSKVGDAEIFNEDFVNAPNGQYISVKVDGELVDVSSQKVVSLTRTLNLKNGLFESHMVIELQNGRQLQIDTSKIANMENTREYAIRYSVTPLNFSGEMEIISEIDGSVYNYNVERYRSLEQHHLDVLKTEAEQNKALLVARTRQSQFTIIEKSELMGDAVKAAEIENEIQGEKVIQTMKVQVQENQAAVIEKYVHMECLTNEQLDKVEEHVQAEVQPKSFEAMMDETAKAWKELWEKTDITIEGDLMSQKLIHLHTFHLLVSASPNGNKGLDASITARGLHGEAYRGHIFWDEIFILPFYIMHFPGTAKQILMYRYKRLGAAKEAAKEAGYEGAMFPWQSGLDGTEQSQEIHLNPMTGNWDKDYSRLQRHVSLAVAYNIWLYWNNTHDKEYMEQYGAEILMEIARFWESAAAYDEESGRYSIDKVMGPDEFHETYPGTEEGGLKNNAYTNMMVVWLFEFIDQLKTIISEDALTSIMEKTETKQDDIALMDDIKTKLALDIDEDGIIGQYEGYFQLKEVDWDYYREKYGNIYRMDRILRAEGLSADDYKVAKQADTLMIFYNFSKEKVDDILSDLKYELPKNYLTKNLQYYLDRTSHGSTLSRVVHSQLAAMVGNDDLAWQLYQEALYSDYQDIQGGTTAEGIHAGVMAATIYITLTTFAGIDIRESKLHVNPHLPEQWTQIKFNIDLDQIHYTFDMTQDTCCVTADRDTEIIYKDQVVTLTANQPQELR
ncbi:glycoside hydrolase family 65 protein [Anaerostipes butyraticus]|uniref:Glycosyl hydrolase n=1 Tax=Anaerostipes butyraticus TaxID=645466 RepID=A0A916Q9A5_9FIRM|nr:glycoside hydrolase family 65 protein [Anaerostipes butyraticus]GFO84194.1 glycosyl hydrolase [Anaerostipes butyraticus]HJC81627.1 hypothetical protein [Candidatus Anaerostipes avicola]